MSLGTGYQRNTPLKEKYREKVLFDKSLLSLCCPPYASPAPKGGGGVCDAPVLPKPGAGLCTGNAASSQWGDAHAAGAKA